jgi:hypothetical protein
MSLKEFDKTFGLSTTLEEEKLCFINRIENSVFDMFEMNYDYQEYLYLFERVCYHLGEDANELIHQNSFLRTTIPKLKTLSNKDFIKTLRVLVALYISVSDKPDTQKIISIFILRAIENANLNLGIKWADGVFYPTGDSFLDTELIDTSLSLLDRYPKEKIDLKNALDNYYAKSLYGVVENCYIAIEGLARQLLNNKKTLDNNIANLLQLLQFSKYWDKIFLNFLRFAHEFRRHAGENRHDLKPSEVEGFLYLSCLIIRATIKTHEELK